MIAETQQGIQKATIVARVQTDARFVQNIEYAHQAHAQLRGKTGSLRFPSTQTAKGTIQAKITQAHLVQETQALLQTCNRIPNRIETISLHDLVADKFQPLLRRHTKKIRV